MPIVAVFDTNVPLSGLLSLGPPFHCLEMARTGRVKGRACPPILGEFADVLHRKLALESDRMTECLAYLLSFLSLVPITGAALGGRRRGIQRQRETDYQKSLRLPDDPAH